MVPRMGSTSPDEEQHFPKNSCGATSAIRKTSSPPLGHVCNVVSVLAPFGVAQRNAGRRLDAIRILRRRKTERDGMVPLLDQNRSGSHGLEAPSEAFFADPDAADDLVRGAFDNGDGGDAVDDRPEKRERRRFMQIGRWRRDGRRWRWGRAHASDRCRPSGRRKHRPFPCFTKRAHRDRAHRIAPGRRIHRLDRMSRARWSRRGGNGLALVWSVCGFRNCGLRNCLGPVAIVVRTGGRRRRGHRGRNENG